MIPTHILRIDCRDAKGLIHAVTGVLSFFGLNITANGEFVDHEFGHFFMRTEFTGDFDREELLAALIGELPEGADVKLRAHRKKNILVLATKEAHCLGDLLIRHASGQLPAHVQGVISNHDDLADLVRRFDIPFHYLPHEGLTREEHEDKLIHVIDQFDPEFIVLAKYMRILTPDFVSRYRNRIINIHHSFLPAFMGANPYKQAFNRGVKIIGATAHFVNDSLDEGPIITQNVINVDHTYSPDDMRQAGRDVEMVVLARALRLVLEDRVFINSNKTIIFE